jgi:hypothetical protein
VSYPSDWEKGASFEDDVKRGYASLNPEPTEPLENVPGPVLGKEQQEYLARAAAEAMANLSLLLPPILAQFQALASTALPALRKAVEPFAQALKEMDLTPGKLEGLALAEEMDAGLNCLRCNPPRRVAPGLMKRHLDEVHGRRIS